MMDNKIMLWLLFVVAIFTSNVHSAPLDQTNRPNISQASQGGVSEPPNRFNSEPIPVDSLLKNNESVNTEQGQNKTENQHEFIPYQPDNDIDLDELVRLAVRSNDEYEMLLQKLKQEAADSIGHPANYVDNDDDLEELIKKFETSGTNKILEEWYSRLPENIEENLCPICYEEMNPEDEFKISVCGHIFHKICLSQWERRGFVYDQEPGCPYCRRPYEQRATRRSEDP